MSYRMPIPHHHLFYLCFSLVLSFLCLFCHQCFTSSRTGHGPFFLLAASEGRGRGFCVLFGYARLSDRTGDMAADVGCGLHSLVPAGVSEGPGCGSMVLVAAASASISNADLPCCCIPT